MIASSDTVLVTGINGYIGAHVALSLLHAGYQVRGAVRSAAKGERLRQEPHFQRYADRLTIVEVADISKPGAYDDAVKDVAIVVHLASPVFLGGDYDSVIAPAKKGALGLLNSILDHSSPTKFRQLVYFSSIAAQTRLDAPKNYTFTEKDWNPSTEESVRNMEPSELGRISYFASKAIAERAVWEFLDTHKPTWTTCVLNPAVVYGPIIHPVSSPSELNMTTKPAWDIFTGATKEISEGLAAGAYVDVRDVATITTYAVEHPNEVAGGRFPLVAGSGPPQAIADILRESFPERQHLIPEGKKGEGYQPGTWGFGSGNISFSSRLVEDLTNIDWIPFDKSIKDTVQSFQDVFGI